MQAGDHLVSTRVGYTHHGIYIGNDYVIHYAGFSDGFKKDLITLTTLDEFKNGNDVTVKNYILRTHNYEETVSRAYSRLGEDMYNALINNCEHFATWCVMGIHSSSQVNSHRTAAELTIGSSIVGRVAASPSTLISSGIGSTAGIAVSALTGVASLASTAILPVVAVGVVSAAAGYGLKKAWDWLTD
ncbi:MAG: lecithin retinol acyltransferase family protein [Rhodoferax sp.]|nr:lecithin retinol acyltransferase family protein [Rhodoferax sp.]